MFLLNCLILDLFCELVLSYNNSIVLILKRTERDIIGTDRFDAMEINLFLFLNISISILDTYVFSKLVSFKNLDNLL